MSMIYVTGTRQPGTALKRFLPDFIELLIQQGEQVMTSNKKGVDALVIQHCDAHHLPLHVCEFSVDSSDYKNRRVKVRSEAVQVQRIVSPTWLRFRHLAEKADKMIFLHASQTRGKCDGLPTTQAFALACQRRGVVGEQFIIQSQHKAWIAVQELRNAPIIGAVHLYVYARAVSSMAGTRHSIAHFRLETWRQMGAVIQPGIGRREWVFPELRVEQAGLQVLQQVLHELQPFQPAQLVVHYANSRIEQLAARESALFPAGMQVRWQHEAQSDLLHQIGLPISKAQELWNHTKAVKAYRGLYQ